NGRDLDCRLSQWGSFVKHGSDAVSLPRTWDSFETHWVLSRLTLTRARFRIERTLRRIRSPRRIIATTLAVAFFALYLLNGIFILSAREAADPERLRLWLSGGMVIYAVYHGVRCGWSKSIIDLELTPAETLWLGGAPICRSSLAIYHVGSMVVPAALKTGLLAVVLIRDVSHFEMLVVGMFTSLILLEITRLIVARMIAGMSTRHRRLFRFAVTGIALAIGFQVLARIMAITPVGSQTWLYVLNGFRALGDVASSPMIQWLAVPWIPAAHLTVTDQYQWITLSQVLATACVLPLSILLLVRTDQWSSRQQHRSEQVRLAAGDFETRESHAQAYTGEAGKRALNFLQRVSPAATNDVMTLVARQAVSVRRYGATIVFSFLVPCLLCLSPLVTGQVTEQWFYVVGGIALCTMLLAPPALRIDFRRDLKRMLLLRSLPINPFSMVVGQLALPILITWSFQWITIAIAAAVTQPGWGQFTLWTGMLAALAVLTFAGENALFLAYPHHERSEGVAMMIRAKLTFLGKGSVIALALGMLVAWATVCRWYLPESYVATVFVVGAIASTWGLAIIGIAAATSCWRRFDFACDTPPE
ncbi:MAG: hypothetical protein ACR2NZ_06290, partial [Rubripirellula sp.]